MKILKINKKNLKKAVEIAAKTIKQGRIVVCPTDTVYGLLADATQKKAVEKIFKIKKRAKRKPIPIFVKDIKTAKKMTFIDKKQEKFLKEVWPGRVTVILKRKKTKKKLYGIQKNKIGLRVPKHKLVNTLLKKLNRPLTGTSANISGKPASTEIEEILRQFEKEKNKPDLILDAGNLPFQLPSTVIDLTPKKPKILRRGTI